MERKAWFQSEQARLAVETTARNLIPAYEVEEGYATLVKLLVQALVSLPDVLERDHGLTPAQVDGVHKSINRTRQALYDAVIASALPHKA